MGAPTGRRVPRPQDELSLASRMWLISQLGQQDGIRWGDIGWGNNRRRYQYDLITGAVRLFQMEGRIHNGSPEPEEDVCPKRLAAARAIIERAAA